MANPTGMIEIHWEGKKQFRPAYRIGKLWSVNASTDHCKSTYNVTHIPTGLRLAGYLGYRHACKLVGVLDVLLPFQEYSDLKIAYRALPNEVKKAIAAQQQRPYEAIRRLK